MGILLNPYAWVGLIALFAVSFGWHFAENYKAMAAENSSLRRDLNLRDHREASYRRMIDRRDAAIKQTKCAAQIQRWVKNPDEIPKPFDPFNQLNPQQN